VILVDTSSWIHFLRPKGSVEVRQRVERTLKDGEACWCPVVRLELWNGARGRKESAVLRDL
jgi:predicted nucleic acid-binding protein